MDVTSDEIRSSRFQGTRHVYDRREIDAFLHRTAETLEIYERKLAVTEAHVESLEKALDLAHGRARSVRERESRIAELEAALAAAQHNYESALALLESSSDGPPPETRGDQSDVVVDARRRAEEILDAARREAVLTRAEVERLHAESVESAALALATAHEDADQIRRSAHLIQANMLEDIANARREAHAALDLEQARRDAVRAEARARAAELERTELQRELERIVETAAAERKQLIAESEMSVAKAVAQVEADRDRMLHRAQLKLERAEQSASIETPSEEVETLRRRVSQMRTALSNIQQRFSMASKLSPEELELAAALVDLDLHDVDLLVDLTTPTPSDASGGTAQVVASSAAGDAPSDGGAGDDPATEDDAAEELRIKSRFAQSRPAFGRAPVVVAAQSAENAQLDKSARKSDWREKVAPVKAAAPDAEESTSDPALGFYERRLAGLRARLEDAGNA